MTSTFIAAIRWAARLLHEALTILQFPTPVGLLTQVVRVETNAAGQLLPLAAAHAAIAARLGPGCPVVIQGRHSDLVVSPAPPYDSNPGWDVVWSLHAAATLAGAANTLAAPLTLTGATDLTIPFPSLTAVLALGGFHPFSPLTDVNIGAAMLTLSTGVEATAGVTRLTLGWGLETDDGVTMSSDTSSIEYVPTCAVTRAIFFHLFKQEEETFPVVRNFVGTRAANFSQVYRGVPEPVYCVTESSSHPLYFEPLSAFSQYASQFVFVTGDPSTWPSEVLTAAVVIAADVTSLAGTLVLAQRTAVDGSVTIMLDVATTIAVTASSIPSTSWPTSQPSLQAVGPDTLASLLTLLPSSPLTALIYNGPPDTVPVPLVRDVVEPTATFAGGWSPQLTPLGVIDSPLGMLPLGTSTFLFVLLT